MLRLRRSDLPSLPSAGFVMLLALFVVLWIAGGASRADVIGQMILRVASVLLLIAAVLVAPRPTTSSRPIWLLFGATLLLVLLQLIPLPPSVWPSLPGRTLFVEAALASGQSQPWRPLTIVPGATMNAAASLIVPLATLVLVTVMRPTERAWLPGLLLAVVTASMAVGMIQFTGAALVNPFVNSGSGVVDGLFANRNHFALFLAIGIVVAAGWAFTGGGRWRGPVALALIVLFALVILASGSRAGVLLGGLSLVIAPMLVRHKIRRQLDRYPRWVRLALIGALCVGIVLLVVTSALAGRATSIDRILASGAGQDLRRQNLPLVLAMIGTYFPAGSGIGGFDTIFRIHEPFELLAPDYFNHAHNDFLEIAMDAGLAGIALTIAALGWWMRVSMRVWRRWPSSPLGSRDDVEQITARVGSAVLFLIFVASAFDYPARTPMIMAVIVIAAWCLASHGRAGRPSTLRQTSE